MTPTFALFRGGEKVHSHGGINETNLHRVGGWLGGCVCGWLVTAPHKGRAAALG